MTLQQLRYIIAIAECGSITSAAKQLLVAQPSVSKAVTDLEAEMGITIFYRNNRGVFVSDEGSKFLSYARQVIEQADLLEQQYTKKEVSRRVFAISAQHYAFVVNAFVSLVKEYDKNKYEFTLRESRTYDIIEDVQKGRSELGVLFLSKFNRHILCRTLDHAGLTFTSLFTAKPHVFISRHNPLAKKRHGYLKRFTTLSPVDLRTRVE